VDENVAPAVAIEYRTRGPAYLNRVTQVNRDVAPAVQDDGFSPSLYAVATAAQGGADALVLVTFTPALPGVYTGKIRVDASVNGPQGAASYRAVIPFTYTVSDNAAVLAFYYPPQVVISTFASSTAARFPPLVLLSRPGVSVVNSVVPALPPRSGVLTPEETASRTAS